MDIGSIIEETRCEITNDTINDILWGFGWGTAFLYEREDMITLSNMLKDHRRLLDIHIREKMENKHE